MENKKEEQKEKSVEKPAIKGVHTYAGDMIKILEGNKDGTIRRLIHDQEEHELQKKNLSPESKKNQTLFVASLSLIMLAFVALAFLYFFKPEEISTVRVRESFKPIIYTDRSSVIEVTGLTKEKLSETAITKAHETTAKVGGIEGIYLIDTNKKIMGFSEFLDFIEAGIDRRALAYVNNNFMLGATNRENQDIFFLLKVTSSIDVFDYMRAWESKLFYDLHGFFGFKISPETSELLTRDFQSEIVQNKNARVLRDQEGSIVMMYVYADDKSVIITNTQDAVYEVMLRLSGGKIKK